MQTDLLRSSIKELLSRLDQETPFEKSLIARLGRILHASDDHLSQVVTNSLGIVDLNHLQAEVNFAQEMNAYWNSQPQDYALDLAAHYAAASERCSAIHFALERIVHFSI